MNYSSYDTILSVLGGFAIILFAIIVIGVVAIWKMFKKTGRNGWECIIPIYSYWVLAEIAGLNWWWFLIAVSDSIVSLVGLDNLQTLANLASLVATFNIYYNIAKKFNKSNGTAICAGIFSFIFIFIFGFSKNAVYDNNVIVSKNGIFGSADKNINN